MQQISEQKNKYLHSKLPIDADETILDIYRHHWFAYVSNWLVGGFTIVVVMAIAIVFTSLGGPDSALASHRAPIIAGAAIFSAFILLGTMLPVYLRSQEQVVLTEEALLQVLKPTLFSNKIDQLNLQHIADISVHQDFFGTMLGYGHITIETPGEQDNYEFNMLPNPHQTARDISQAHENYDAAMQSGRVPTSFSAAQPQAPIIDPQQYQQFLQYQQMVAQQQAAQQQSAAAPQPEPTTPQPTPPSQPDDQNSDANASQQPTQQQQ